MPAPYPLILLHALPLDARMWSPQVRALGAQGTVLAPDFPGFGSANARPQEAVTTLGPSVDAWARDLASSLRAAGYQKAVFAGCSMGGYVALALLRVAPDLIAGIALVGSRAAADTDAQRAARFAAIERIQREGASPWAREFVQKALSQWTLEHKPETARAADEIVENQSAESIIMAQRALAARPDSTELWVNGPLTPPARLIVHGEDDAFVPFEEAVALAERSTTRLVVVPDAGHITPMEKPERVSEAIGAWWLRHGSS